MTHADALRIMSNRRSWLAAIALLRRAEAQPATDDGYSYLTQLGRCSHPRVVALASWAYDQVNDDLGLGWRHRYCRTATWLAAERKRRWLQMPVWLACSRCHNWRDQGHKTCRRCRMRKVKS